jgi:hypothetical protein
MSPYSVSKNKPSKKPNLLATCFTLISCLAYSPILKMETAYSSETSVDFQQNTRRYIPEDIILLNHSCENLKSYKKFISIKWRGFYRFRGNSMLLFYIIQGTALSNWMFFEYLSQLVLQWATTSNVQGATILVLFMADIYIYIYVYTKYTIQ